MNLNKRIVIAITGASGSIYALRLIQVLTLAGRDVDWTISPAGFEVLKHETELSISEPSELFEKLRLDQPLWEQLSQKRPGAKPLDFENDPYPPRYFDCENFTAPIASGSNRTAAMVVCPCSHRTLGAIASGSGDNLIHRAAEVHLKERRPLVLVPRETPVSLIHLENLVKLTRAGAVVLPASPAFYHKPQNLWDLIDFIVARICDVLGVEHGLVEPWGVS
jgi:flavin prenyltransferase